jgi:hypothetical protein
MEGGCDGKVLRYGAEERHQHAHVSITTHHARRLRLEKHYI